MIIFLIGPACSGKTWIRQEIWEDATVVDVFDFQKRYKNIVEAENKAFAALIDAVSKKKTDETVIFESPLSNRDRRIRYVDGVKRIMNAEDEIVCLIAYPEEEDREYLIRSKLKDASDDEVEYYIENAEAWYNIAKPSVDEGFNSVLVIRPIVYQKENV